MVHTTRRLVSVSLGTIVASTLLLVLALVWTNMQDTTFASVVQQFFPLRDDVIDMRKSYILV